MPRSEIVSCDKARSDILGVKLWDWLELRLLGVRMPNWLGGGRLVMCKWWCVEPIFGVPVSINDISCAFEYKLGPTPLFSPSIWLLYRWMHTPLSLSYCLHRMSQLSFSRGFLPVIYGPIWSDPDVWDWIRVRGYKNWLCSQRIMKTYKYMHLILIFSLWISWTGHFCVQISFGKIPHKCLGIEFRVHVFEFKPDPDPYRTVLKWK
jgi:hypothetical protein